MDNILNRENLDTIRKIAKEWEPGVFIFKPFDGDFVFLAVDEVTMYSPSDHIHHTTVKGKDISLVVSQRFDATKLQGKNPISTYINNIEYEDEWEVPAGERFLWLKNKQRF
jgi:hypothetical protein